MTSFSLARRLRAGETVYCGWCAMPAPILLEVLAREGFPAVAIDMQHGMWDFAGAVTGIGAIRGAGAAPIVRVPLGGFAMVSRALDMGAEGIVAPMINTVEDAKKFVAVAKFPPLGERSWGPNRAMMLAAIPRRQILSARRQRYDGHHRHDRNARRDGKRRRDRGDARHRRALCRPFGPLDHADRRRHARSAFERGR